jgi:hypothetical protein
VKSVSYRCVSGVYFNEAMTAWVGNLGYSRPRWLVCAHYRHSVAPAVSSEADTPGALLIGGSRWIADIEPEFGLLLLGARSGTSDTETRRSRVGSLPRGGSMVRPGTSQRQISASRKVNDCAAGQPELTNRLSRSINSLSRVASLNTSRWSARYSSTMRTTTSAPIDSNW